MNRTLFYSVLLLAFGAVVFAAWQVSKPGGNSLAQPQASANPAKTVDKQSSGKPSQAPKAKAAKGGGRPGRSRGPVTVNVATAETIRIEETVSAVGSLLAARSVQLAPETDGRVIEVGLQDGARVKAGDLLFRLDDSVTEAELAQAQAELSLARADLKRARNLAKQSFVSKQSREEAAANVKVLAAKLAVVSARLAKSRIVAPFNGRSGLVGVNVGEYVTKGTALVRLDDLSSLKLDIRVPERLLAQVQAGQSIRVSFDAYPAREFNAKVETIDTAIDSAGRSLVVRGRIKNDEDLLRPGMFARARLVIEARESAVVIPEESVLASAEGEYVFAVSDGKAQRRSVQTGARRDGRIEILKGVEAGEAIVTAGQLKLRGDAVPVKVISPVRGLDDRRDAGLRSAPKPLAG